MDSVTSQVGYNRPEKATGGDLVKEVETPLPQPERATRSFIAHTPTPWHTDRYHAYIWGPAQEMIADSSMGDLPDNAVVRARGVGGKLPIKANVDFIVHACNAHDDLLAALNVALNEFHHPGACRYERGQDIVDFIEATIKKAKTP